MKKRFEALLIARSNTLARKLKDDKNKGGD